MKKLLITLLFTGFTFAQTAYLTEGDSTLEKSTIYKSTFTLLAVTDSSNTFTDSLVVETYVHEEWINTAIMGYGDRSWYTLIVPGDGTTKMYIVQYPTFNAVRVRRTNTANLTVRTQVSFFSLTNY